MTKLVLPVLIQVVIFGIYFYIDARQTTAPDWNSVLRYGLNPLILPAG